MSTLIDFRPNPEKLIQILQVGRVIIADFTDAYYLFVDCTPAEVQEFGTIPFAMFGTGPGAFNLAKLVAAMIVEICPTGELTLPDVFEGEVKSYADLCEETQGNTGNVSDDVDIRLLDGHGRPL